MYFLFLIALFELADLAPKAIAPPMQAEECMAAAAERNKSEALQTEEAKAMGLRYVCMKLVGSV